MADFLNMFDKRTGRRVVGGLAVALFVVTLSVGLMSSSGPVAANACKSGCLSAYNQCRIATNGSSSCDRRFQACVRRCLRR
ncbi:MAG: hypothetical protein AAFV26_08420 [Pseudomonadota bacterium]